MASALLTIHLTASNSFITRKDSGVLAPDFAGAIEGQKAASVPAGEPKRKVMYYVCMECPYMIRGNPDCGLNIPSSLSMGPCANDTHPFIGCGERDSGNQDHSLG